jgi:endogenous inhibitor of DNA gyrase (YacG/DUF329 family)
MARSTAKASVKRCPICREPAAPRGDGSPYPFCTPRCQLVDLSRWLDGDYRIPVADMDGYLSAPPPPDSDES